eukprot:TRINITY_DN6764_c0_g1_i2.p1 TRINITY_DN6764_c0_g1~~TRINITY_DN6764_c0_g1_i2.p1  ORF type:complete len:536 (-),score=227.09 TRINITY_DN6764_c0_g1_i2:174-1781(-)
MYLSLPLPMKTTRVIDLKFVSMDGSRKPVRYGVEVQKSGTILDLKTAVGALTGTLARNLIVVDVWAHKFYKVFKDRESVDDIKDRDIIWVHEKAEDEDGLTHVEVVLRKDDSSASTSYGGYNYNSYSSYSYTRKALFGVPFVLACPTTTTLRELNELVRQRLQRVLRLPSRQPSPATAAAPSTPASGTPPDDDDEATQPMDPEPAVDPPAQLPGPSSQRRLRNEDSESDDEPADAMESESEVEADPPPFSIKLVDNNNDRSDSFNQPRDLDTRFVARGGMYAVHFTRQQTEQFYNDTAEQEVDEDASVARLNVQDDESEAVTLAQCIEQFTQQEKLGPDDPWYCSGCKEFQQATKKFDLWSLPPILIIHLKRFSYKNRYFRDKLETFIDYPLHDLDLSAYVKGPIDPAAPPLYDLFAVSNHYGSLGGGHYTAYAKNKNDSKWYSFDDSSVHKVEDVKARSSAGYVLFYRRRGGDPVPRPSSSNSTASSESLELLRPSATPPEYIANDAADNSLTQPMDVADNSLSTGLTVEISDL